MFQIELKRQREARGLSQQALSDLLNVSQGAVGLWESGKRKPDLETLIRIAKLLMYRLIACSVYLNRQLQTSNFLPNPNSQIPPKIRYRKK